MSKKYLFSFSIGPVQSFISQARKVQDLYAGSLILSDLIDESIKFLKSQVSSFNLIFPNENLESKPNRFICILETDKDINVIGQELEKKVQSSFKSIFSKIFLQEFNKNIDSEKSKKIENQIDNFLNIYCLSLDYKNYSEDFNELEKLFNSVKRLKIFNQVNEEGVKCSLCGERSYHFSSQDMKSNFNKSEKICSVCLVKRFYKRDKKGFESTADIALMETLSHVKNSDKLKAFKECFSEIDGQLYYEENLNNDYYKNNSVRTKKSENEILDTYKTFKSEIKTAKKKLSKYYSLINLDVDSAGDFISGKYLKDKNNLEVYQKVLSESLGNFSKKAKEYIQDPKGQTVYAGGDDFLAFVNINHLLPAMQELKKIFDVEINRKIDIYVNKKVTFSMGVVISHYKIPLSEVLKQSRMAVQKAKNIKEKNINSKEKDAFCIFTSKHSGEIHETIFNHKIKDNENSEIFVSEIMNDIVEYSKHGFISNTWEKNLYTEFSKLTNDLRKALGDDTRKQMYFQEIKRLIERSIIKEHEKKMKDKKDKLINDVNNLLLNSHDLSNFIAVLDISEFISREVNI